MYNEDEITISSLLKTCSRCGETFRTLRRAYFCDFCKRPKRSATAARGRPDQALTFREKQIIRFVYQAKLNKEIAYELHLSEGTIKEYLHRIFRKVGVRNRTDLALWGFAHLEMAA